MSGRNVWLLSVVLCVGILVMASPPPLSAVNTCTTKCTCVASCSTTCLVGPLPDPDLITCAEWGICVTSPTCVPSPGGCPAQYCTHSISGTSGSDTLNGTANRECINGLAGNDTIDGNAGDDQIYAGDGTDTGYGDSGNDCLWGGNGDDYLDGESGYDLTDGGAGADVCFAEIKVSC